MSSLPKVAFMYLDMTRNNVFFMCFPQISLYNTFWVGLLGAHVFAINILQWWFYMSTVVIIGNLVMTRNMSVCGNGFLSFHFIISFRDRPITCQHLNILKKKRGINKQYLKIIHLYFVKFE